MVSSGEETGNEGVWSGRRRNRRRERGRRSQSTEKQSVDINWPFWWLSASFVVLFVSSSSPTTQSLSNLFSSSFNSKPAMLGIPNFDEEHFFDAFKKPPRTGGIRYRDEDTLHRIARPVHAFPVVVQDRRRREMSAEGRRNMKREENGMNEPSLEDIDLIDVLWRADIESEKGTVAVESIQPSEQYERDLQLLTEKSVQASLTREETSRFEDLSKVYFEDFYSGRRYNRDTDKLPRKSSLEVSSSRPSSSSSPSHSSLSSSLSPLSPSPSLQVKRNIPTPTDEDLEALFEDMGKECGQLNRLMPTEGEGSQCPLSSSSSFPPPPTGLINNVSLSSIAPFYPTNLTDLDFISRDGGMGNEQTSSIPLTNLDNNGTLGYPAPTQFWFEDSTDAIDSYQSREPVLNMSTLVIPPLETVSPPHELTTLTSLNEQPSTPFVEPSPRTRSTPSVRVSISNDTSTYSSSSSSSSPHYSTGSDGENRSPRSRYSGKLAPSMEEEEEDTDVSSFFKLPSSSSSSSIPSQPRRRGRQSKDEQLAMANGLPVTAATIAEMSLPELQKLLKAETLTDAQKQLIRKIRRRGKNKVAARTCRQRRGQVRDKGTAGQPSRVLGFVNRH